MDNTRIRLGFIGKYQAPLFMVTKEYLHDKTIYYAESLFEIWFPWTAKKFGINKCIRTLKRR